jgi:hypothetical protein
MHIADYKRSLELDNDKKNAAIEMWKRSLEAKKDQPRSARRWTTREKRSERAR